MSEESFAALDPKSLHWPVAWALNRAAALLVSARL